jgi:type IV secretory pathway component VirB8
MPTLEELEHRISRLEVLFEELIKDRLTYISQRLDQLYEKTERDKTELLEKIGSLYAKTEKYKAEILAKTDRDKRELIYWMVGLMLGFSTLTITAIWAILSFALK